MSKTSKIKSRERSRPRVSQKAAISTAGIGYAAGAVFTLDQVAEGFQTSADTVQRLIARRHLLRIERFKTRVRIAGSEINRYVSESCGYSVDVTPQLRAGEPFVVKGSQVCAAWQISSDALRDLIASGALKRCEYLRRVLIPIAEVERFLSKTEVPAAS